MCFAERQRKEARCLANTIYPQPEKKKERKTNYPQVYSATSPKKQVFGNHHISKFLLFFILPPDCQEIQSEVRYIPKIYPRISKIIISMWTAFNLQGAKSTGNQIAQPEYPYDSWNLTVSGKIIYLTQRISVSDVKCTTRTQRKWCHEEAMKQILAHLFRQAASPKPSAPPLNHTSDHAFLHIYPKKEGGSLSPSPTHPIPPYPTQILSAHLDVSP